MRLFDTHLHFDSFQANESVTDILQDAEKAGVCRMVAIGGGVEQNQLAAQLAEAHPGRIYAALGYDRGEVGQPVDLALVRHHLPEPGVVAVGETGLDYHYQPESAADQCALFQSNLDLASEAHVPVVVHSRDADQDTLRLLRGHAERWTGNPDQLGILHCFTGTWEFARALLDLGLFISFSGILTFKNAEGIREVARKAPADRILVETDAPYLAPVPHRGQTNQPAYVKEVARMVASVRGDTLEDVAEQTFENANRCFGLE